MKRLILVAALLWPSLASAQLLTPSPQSIGAVFSSACTSTTCATWTVGQAASLTLAVSGTFSGTITWYGSSDGGTTYFAISATKLSDGSSASTTTTTGQYAIANSGLSHVQARFTSYVSGGANITAARGYATAALLTPFFLTVSANRFLAGDGTAAAPSYSFTSDTTLGFFRRDTNALGITAAGSQVGEFNTLGLKLAGSNTISWAATYAGPNDTILCRGAANVIGIGGCTSSFPALRRSSASLDVVLGDSSAWATINARTFNSTQHGSAGYFVSGAASATAGSATGLTVATNGYLQTGVYKVTVATTAFVCAATTCDLTIGTLPANTWLTNATAQITATFACTATCTSSTLSFVLGKGSGGAEYLASFDADAATGYFGDADAEMGTLMTRAAAIQGGTFTSGTQAVVLRLTSGTGNIGTGAATNLSQGAITIWLKTTVLP